MRRAVLKAVHRFQVRLDRYKLVSKPVIRDALLRDPIVQAAIRDHCTHHRLDESEARYQVGLYVDEIVPFFDVL
ncbi:MAG: hypothetical protein JSW51_12595, partial [Gemmatimonadota bacterium]